VPANDKADRYPQMGAVEVAVAPVEGGTLQAIPAWGLGEGSKALCPAQAISASAWGLEVVMVFPHSSTVEAGTLLAAEA
jgi:hypothetical protein